MPSPVFFAPTTNNRGIPPNKGQQYHQPSSTNGVRQSNGADPHPARLLTVDEALQYSALSSVVPFSPDVIPLPNVSLPSSQAIFSTASEQQVVRQSIQVLDEDIGRTKGQSALTQHALQNLLPYLDRGSITRFKFKTPSGFNSSHPDPHFPTNDHVNIKPSTHLGPFANMLLQATDLSHRYPTPKSPGTSPHENHTSQKTSRQSLPVTPTTPQRFVQNQAAYSQNGLYPTSDISLSTAERKKLYPVVLVPPLSAESRQSYYITTPDGPSNQEVSRKRKRDTGIENIGDTTKTIDQRSISDDASRVLQELVQEILEADDQSDLALSGIKLSEISKFFVPVGDGDQMLFTLAPATQVKLETSMQKAIALGRFGDVPVDHLSRLQKICQVTLTSAETVEIHIETGWNEDDALQWAQKIEVAYAGLRSARIIVRTMVGGREEKQLCSEELLQSVLDMIKRTLDSCVIPVVESRATGSTSELYDFALPFRKIISQLLYDTDKVLRLLTELLAKVELAETTITAMEFFAARILFVENAQTEKDSVLGIQKFESVRRTAMDILAEIFSRYPEQRTFLIDEILISLQKLPVTRQHARQYKLPDGKTIQLVSALIMRLVQTSAIRSTTAAKKQKKRPQPKQDGEVRISQESPIEESTEDESTSTDTDSHYSKSSGGSESVEKECCDAALQRLHNDVSSLSESANKSAQHVVQFFVQRALTAPKTGDQPHR
ncbi:Sister chromatid cohesion protein 2, partial [Toensbergia leucococca]|nr:Sister chromatid cohesion protein 2 [Toensbergia leucococca]